MTIGFGFLAKMGEALLVVPAFACVYLLAAPTSLRRRVGPALVAGAAMVLSAGWWVAAVALWPAGSRPMIDGSPDEQHLEPDLRLQRPGPPDRQRWRRRGSQLLGRHRIFRLFNSLMGSQAAWLLPAAVAVLVGGLGSR